MVRQTLPQRLFAVLVAAMGLVNILSALLVHEVVRNALLHMLLPMELTHASRTLTLVAGFGLIIVAYGLWRGKHTAWLVTLGLLGISAVVHLAKGLDWEEAAIALVLGFALWSQRKQFVRRSDPPTLRRLPLVAGFGVLAITGYALLGFWLLRAFQPFSLELALQELGAQVLWLDGPYAPLVHGHAAWFLDSLSVLSLLFVSGIAVMLLRPVLPRAPRAEERARADMLLARFSSSSLAPFAQNDDKQLYFGEQVEGLVAYRVSGGVAVVCGDPIAAPEHVGMLAQEFTAFCQRQDWQTCFYEVQPRFLPDYAPLGYTAVKIGEDAWINLAQFTLKGSKISDIRHAVSKVQRDGTTFRVLGARADEWSWLQMQTIEAEWRATQGGIQLQFSIGHLTKQPQPDAQYTVALAEDGQTVLAFCSFLPIKGIHGLALDVMRRASDCPNGTMEFLLARSLEHFRDAGFMWCSLGLAPLANIEAPNGGLLERAIHAIYTNPTVNANYHYQSLFFFKRKFNPEWRGGYLLFPHALALPQVVAAVARVHVGHVGPQVIRRTSHLLREEANTPVAC